MSLPNRILYKILGKVELAKKNNGILNTYYIVQWNSQFGPITVQSRMSLINYDDKIAEFEAKSTVNHFPSQSSTKSCSDVISSSEAATLIDILKQYDDRQNGIINGDNLQNNFSESGNFSESMENNRMISSHSYVSETNKMGSDYNESLYCNDKRDTSSTDKNEIDIIKKKSNAQTSTTVVGCDEGTSNEIISGVDSDDESIYSVGDFNEKYRNTPDTYRDFSDIESSIVADSYENWQLKWWNIIDGDDKKSGGKRNWKTLEFISEIFRDSVHYFIGYDTETKLMTLIKENEIPESEKEKLDAFKKFQNK